MRNEAEPLTNLNSIQVKFFTKRITLCFTPHTILLVELSRFAAVIDGALFFDN
jgi:hypothetical protein